MKEQKFYGHGKLLLSGDYFILDGAKSLALPTTYGQKMTVRYQRGQDFKLYWTSYDSDGKVWYQAVFETWRFECLEGQGQLSDTLAAILKQARKQNVHFLREGVDIHVETYLEFPLSWELGSRSTLVYNIAQWAYISPFELYNKTFGDQSSGYEIACAQATGPICFQLRASGPSWELVSFNPHFKDKLYFLFLNKKHDLSLPTQVYSEISHSAKVKLVKKITALTDALSEAVDLKEFEDLLLEHESLVALSLDSPKLQSQAFMDYWGVVKPLGPFGGDFALVTSSRSKEETLSYFKSREHHTLIPYNELILQDYSELNAPSCVTENENYHEGSLHQ